MKNIKYYILFFLLILLFPLNFVQAKNIDRSDLSFLKGAQHRVYQKEVSRTFVSPAMSGEKDKKLTKSATSTKAANSKATSIKTAKNQAATAIYRALLSFEKTVDLSAYRIPYSDETASELLDRALDKNQYLFNILANFTDFSEQSEFCSCYTSGDFIDSFEFQYNASPATLTKQYNTLTKKVNAIRKSLALEGKSPEEIILRIHDYIALHTDYDTAKKPKRKSFTAYGTLINGKSVCSGYATASKILLESYGIPVEIATSDAMDHAWSLVKLHGKWYHMDITWDDPYPSKKKYVTYWFFLKTDKEFKNHKKANHYKWDSSGIKCTSKRYSKIPITDNNRLFHSGSYWYFMNNKKTSSGLYTYRKYNFTFTKSSALASSTLPFVKYQSRIYYVKKRNQIVSMNPNSKVSRMIHQVSKNSSAKIISMKIKNDKIFYTYRLKGKTKKGTKKLTAQLKKTAS